MASVTLPEGRLGHALLTRKSAQIGEMAVLFAVPLAVILIAVPMVGENPVAQMGVVWVANVIMLLIVWLGLRVRNQTWAHLGLSFHKPERASVVRTLLLSLVVFGAALVGFLVGSVVMANIVGIPEGADMSGYNYLYHNLPLLIVSLLGVYLVSTFGEEVIYRGFLITRIEEMGSGGKWVGRFAVVMSAVIFGLIHYSWGPMGMGQTAFMGLALAIAYVKLKRNLWINVIAHGYMDTILLVPLFFVQGSAGVE